MKDMTVLERKFLALQSEAMLLHDIMRTVDPDSPEAIVYIADAVTAICEARTEWMHALARTILARLAQRERRERERKERGKTRAAV